MMETNTTNSLTNVTHKSNRLTVTCIWKTVSNLTKPNIMLIQDDAKVKYHSHERDWKCNTTNSARTTGCFILNTAQQDILAQNNSMPLQK